VASSTLYCSSCLGGLAPGAALRVMPRDGRAPFAICRPAVRGLCLRLAGGLAESSSIELWDPAAARAFDRAEAQAFARQSIAAAHEPTTHHIEAAGLPSQTEGSER